MGKKTRTHRVVAELAERQHGVVSARQLAAAGLSAKKISGESELGRLHHVHHAAYAVGHMCLSRQGRCLAAVLSCGEGAILSHRSAAWLWGLTTRWHEVIDITASSPRHTRPAIRVHSARTLLPEDKDSSEGIPVTAVPRTLLDFAAVDPRFIGVVLDRAERRGLLDLAAIEAMLARSRGFRGARRLRTALAPYRTPAFTRSGLERRFLGLVRDAGLPRPSINFFVEGYELDAYWPAERFGVELDTYDYHGGRRSFEDDRLRQESLKLAGIEMVRITGARLDREPRAVIKRLRRLLEQRRRDLSRNPQQ
jgi:hypothetical protein